MAIVIEESGPKTSLTKIAVWIMVLGTVVISIYYIFFRRPALVDVVVPPTFQNTQTLSTIKLSPEEVVQSYAFQILKQHVEVSAPTELGRENPFLAFEGATPAILKR